MQKDGNYKDYKRNPAGWFITAVFSICLIACTSSKALSAAEGSDVDSVQFVIVFPGGPTVGSSSQNVINQFVDIFAKDIGGQVTGSYFTDIETARAFLRDHPNSFVMATTGFFLSQCEELGLVPLAALQLPDDRKERYYVVTKSGTAGSLEDLKGKTMAGQVLLESECFLNRVVFGGMLDVGSDIKLIPTGRPLSALRKMIRGELDAVILNPIQYSSLEQLPFAGELETVFTSDPITPIGFSMRDSETNHQLRDRVMLALQQLSKTEDGLAACQSFGIAGFEAVDQAMIDQLLRLYTKQEVSN